MGFISWLNKLFNPNHNWTDYDENGNMTGRGLIENANKLLNPNHNWMDYDKIHSIIGNFADATERGLSQLADPEQLTSWVNSQTGAHMTNSEVERNEMQMQNQEDIYQRQVSGMQKAGLNPALMYQSGASSAPSAPSPSQPGLNMSDIMQALLLDKQARLLDSQANNTDADTDKKKAETAYQSLINKYYPSVTDSQIKKVLSEAGVNEKTIDEIGSRIELQDLEKELKRVDNIIKQAEADESSAYYKARREYEEAQGAKAKQEKAEIAVRAAIEDLERNFMQHTNTRMGSSTVVAVASAIGTLLSNFQLPDSVTPEGNSGLPFDNDEFRSSLKRDLKKLFDWIDSHSTAVD